MSESPEVVSPSPDESESPVESEPPVESESPEVVSPSPVESEFASFSSELPAPPAFRIFRPPASVWELSVLSSMFALVLSLSASELPPVSSIFA